MKNQCLIYSVIIAFMFIQNKAVSQSILLNDPAALVKVEANNKGILIPRMSQSQRDAISNAVKGLIIYQTDNNKGVYQYNGSTWLPVGNNGPTYLNGNGIIIDNQKNIELSIQNQSPGDMFYFDGNNWIRIPKGNEGQKMCLVNGVPTWVN